MKKIISIILCLTFLVGLCPTIANGESPSQKDKLSENGLLLSAATPSVTASGTCGSGLSWILKDKVLSVSGSGAMTDYSRGSVPWSEYGDQICEVDIGSGVTSVGTWAFADLSLLSEVYIAETVTEVKAHAFENCPKLYLLAIPESISSIGDSAFRKQNDTQPYEGRMVLYFMGDAPSVTHFSSAPLVASFGPNVSILHYSDATGWNDEVWSSYNSLTPMEHATNILLNYSGEYFVVGSDYYPSAIVTGAGQNSVTNSNYRITSSNPDVLRISYDEYGYKRYELCGEGICTVTATSLDGGFTDSVTIHVGTSYFPTSGNCGATGANATWQYEDNTLTISGTGAMKDYMRDWSAWTLDHSSLVPWYMWAESIETLIVNSGITHLSSYATAADTPLLYKGGPALQRVSLPASLTSIGEGAFYSCESLVSISIPSGVAEIPDNCFEYCGTLNSVVLPEGITQIGSRSFGSCSLLSGITLPESLSSIGQSAFQQSGLRSVVIPEVTTALDVCAFQGITGLREVTFSGETAIGDHAFSDCINLSSVTFLKGPPTSYLDGFSYCADDLTLHCFDTYPSWTQGSAYDASDGTWNGIRLEVHSGGQGGNTPGEEEPGEIIASGICGETVSDNLNWTLDSKGTLTILGSGHMANYTILYENITTAYTMSQYMDGTSPWNSYRSNIKRIVIKSGVLSIGTYAFLGCEALTSVSFPDTLGHISGTAFEHCSSLKSLTIPASVYSAGASGSCYSLSEICVSDGSVYFKSIDGILFSANGTAIVWYPAGKVGAEYQIPGDVVEVASGAFDGQNYLSKVIIPSSVKRIGDVAFQECAGLTEVLIHSKLDYIGYGAFSGLQLQKAIFTSDAPTEIKSNAFTYFPGHNFTILCKASANGWKNTSAYDSQAGTWNGYPIQFYTQLESTYTVASGQINSSISWNLNSDGTLTIEGSGPMPDYLYNYDYPRSGEMRPPWYNYIDSLCRVNICNGITYIGDYAFAFARNSLRQINIAGSVEKIGERAFYGNCAASLVLPEGIREVGPDAFGFGSIRYLSLPSTLASLGDSPSCHSDHNIYSTWGSNPLEFIEVAGGNQHFKSEGGVLFSKDGLTLLLYPRNSTRKDYVVPSSVTTIGDSAFFASNLVSITLGSNIKYVRDNAFVSCDILTSISFPEALEEIGDNAFHHCDSLTEIIIPGSVNAIGDFAFASCPALKKVTIQPGVQKLGRGSFQECSELEKVILPEGLSYNAYPSYYSTGAFYLCPKLVTAGPVGGHYNIELGFQTAFPSNVLSGIESLTSLIVPSGVTSMSRYSVTDLPNLSKVVIPASVNDFSYGSVFAECPKLTTAGAIGSGKNIEFGWNNSIPAYAFSNLETLSSVVVPSGITTIEAAAFSNCSALTSVLLPGSLRTIEGGAFSNCTSLGRITLPEGLTTIGWCFYGCRALSKITIPSTLVNVASGFLKNTAIRSVGPIGSGCDAEYAWAEEIPAGAFSENNAPHMIYKVEFPASLVRIGATAFESCEGITSVVLPEALESIGYGAFRDTGLSGKLFIPANVKQIDNEAFGNCQSVTGYYFKGLAPTVYHGSFPEDAILYCHFNMGFSVPEWNGYETQYWSENQRETIEVDSGVLRNGSGWEITWSYTAQKDIHDVLGYGTLTIKMYGRVSNGGEISLLYDGGTNYPWLNNSRIQKSKIQRIEISGNTNGKLVIPQGAFQGYRGLKSLELNYISSVGESAFSGNSKLESVSLSNVNTLASASFAETAIRVITLDRSLSQVATTALPLRNDLLIRCYTDTYAHRFAETNNFRFRLLDALLSNTVFYGNGEHITFGIDIDTNVILTSSTTYNPDLSYKLMALSYAAYDENNVKSSYESLGFSRGDFQTFSYYADPNDSRYGKDNVAYTFGRKTMANGETLVLITIRGSYGEFMQSSDWWSDFNITNVSGRHTGFETAKVKVYNALWSWLGGIPKTGVRYVITGHSRGAAVSNLLALQLSDDGVSKNNVYAYNFACPDVAIASVFDFNWLGNHDNIFNLCRREDPITLIPSVLCNGTALPTLYWGKFGQTLWFSDSKSYVLDINSHSQDLYLDFTSRRLSLANFFETPGDISQDILRNMWGFFTAILCPVDVEVTDRDGNVIAAVRNGQIEYSGSEVPTNMFILIDGEEKYVFIPGNADYKVNLVGTDIGTMTYAVYEANMLSGEVKESATYSNVRLENGKEMTSQVGTTTEVRNVSLFVDDGNPDNVQIISSVGEETNHSHSFSWMPFKSNGEVASVIDYSFSCDCGYVSPGTDRFSIIYDAVTEQLSADSDIPGGFNVVIGLYDGQNKFIGTIFLSESQPTAAVPENATTIRVFLLDSENYSPKAVSVRLK